MLSLLMNTQYIAALFVEDSHLTVEHLKVRKRSLFLPSFIPISVLFISLCRPNFLSGILFLLSEEFPLTSCIEYVCWRLIPLVFA